MEGLSDKARELLGFFRKEYKLSGYMQSGSWPIGGLKQIGYDIEAIHELQKAGLVQRRDCNGYVYELTPNERGALISDYGLCSVWYEQKGNAWLFAIQEEVRRVAEIPLDEHTGDMTVSTYKIVGDRERPDKMKVYCPFSVGQVVNLEYDLPRKLRWVGYRETTCSDGRNVGQFMVTNVVHNMLVDPPMNMIEVQSLCEGFNKLYPQERTMMVFEDVLLTRMKEINESQFVLTHGASSMSIEPVGFSHELSTDVKKKMFGSSPTSAYAGFSPLSVEELVAHATAGSRSLEAIGRENIKEKEFEKE